MSYVQEAKPAHAAAAIPSVATLLKQGLSNVGITKRELSRKAGFNLPNVISMIVAGSMKLPSKRVSTVAKILGIDPVFLFRSADAEYDWGTFEVMEAMVGRTVPTLNEEKMILKMRELSGGRDIDTDAYGDVSERFIASFASMVDRETKSEAAQSTETKH